MNLIKELWSPVDYYGRALWLNRLGVSCYIVGATLAIGSVSWTSLIAAGILPALPFTTFLIRIAGFGLVVCVLVLPCVKYADKIASSQKKVMDALLSH